MKRIERRYHEPPGRGRESLLRGDMDPLDFVSQEPGGQCDAELRLSNGLTHFCTRRPGHGEEHYSFSGVDPLYEIIWPRGTED